MTIKRLVWLATLILLLAPPALARLRPLVPAEAAAPAAPGVAVAPGAPDALSTVYFAAGTTQIRTRDMSILDAHAVWQRDEEKRVLVIEGYTDGPEDSEFSRGFGARRATSAKAYLMTRGVLADRIVTESRGEGRSACQEKTPACRALNRRATVSREVRP